MIGKYVELTLDTFSVKEIHRLTMCVLVRNVLLGLGITND
jgi:hypothetical protein